MKKIVLLIAMLTATLAFAIITDPMSNQFDNTGAVSKRDKAFISVKNSSGSTVSDGWVMVYSTSTDDGITVTTSTTNGTTAACVVADGSGSIADGAMIPKCQVFGYHSGVQFGSNLSQPTTATAGEAIFVTNAAGKVSGLSATETDTALEVVKLHKIGIALDTSTTSGVIESFLNLL